MSPLRKGVPARLSHSPIAGQAGGKVGASDLSYITVNSDNYPDIYCPVGKNVKDPDLIGDSIRDVGGNNTKTKGIYTNLTFSERTHSSLKIIKVLVLIIFFYILLGFRNIYANPEKYSAKGIMDRTYSRTIGTNRHSDMKLFIREKDGYERTRIINLFRTENETDRRRMLYVQEPVDVKDFAFFTIEYNNSEKDDDQWLYVPALRKTKRIATSDRSSSFLGSDFTYADLNRRKIEFYKFIILKEMAVNGYETWLIEAIPTDEKVIKETGYTKSIFFVTKEHFVIIRAIHWVKNEKKLKYFNVKELKLIDGIWVPIELQMRVKKGKEFIHSSVIKFYNTEFNYPLPNNFYSTHRLDKPPRRKK